MSTDYSTQQGGHDGNTTHKRGLLTMPKPLKKPEPAKDCPSPGEELDFYMAQDSRVALAEDVGGLGLHASAALATTFAKATAGELDEPAVREAMRAGADEVARGKLESVERMLYGQAVTLNAIFAAFAHRGAEALAEHPQAAETYMRVALRAQSQCARTAEVLGNLRAGPTIFAKQANVTTGPQQVNNHASPPARAQEPKKSADELLEDTTHEQQWMDTGAQAAPARGNPAVEAVGAVDRAEIGKG